MASAPHAKATYPPRARAFGLRIMAEAMEYPYRGFADRLDTAARSHDSFPGRSDLVSFIRTVRTIRLGEWEELYTRSFDLHPASAPYVGYHVWGDKHARGAFMGRLAQAQRDAGIEPGGELPDHLALVLQYLGAQEERRKEPLPELIRVLGPALESLAAALADSFAQSPYAHILSGTREAVDSIPIDDDTAGAVRRRPT